MACGGDERKFTPAQGGAGGATSGSAGDAPFDGGSDALGGEAGQGQAGQAQAGQAGSGALGGQAGESQGGAPATESLIQIDVVDPAGVALAGVALVANAADGGFVRRGSTDAQGHAALLVPSGGSVSALVERNYMSPAAPSDQRHLRAIYTAMALPDGASVVFSTEPLRTIAGASAPALDVLTVNFSPATGISEFRLLLSCLGASSTGGGSISIGGYRGCGEATYDLYALGLGATGAPVRYGIVRDLPLTGGASVTHDVELSETQFEPVALSFAGLPGSAVGVAADVVGYWNGSGTPVALAHLLTPGVPAQPFEIWIPSGVFDQLFLRAGVSTAGSLDRAFGIDRYLPSLPATVGFPQAVAAVSARPTLDDSDPARPKLAWTLAEDATLGELVRTSLSWSVSAAGSDRTFWRALHPPARSGTVTLPELPEDLAAYRPTVLHQLSTPQAWHGDAQNIVSYADYLADNRRERRLNSDWTIAGAAASVDSF